MTTTTKETAEQRLVHRINSLHKEVIGSFRTSLRKAKEAGDALREAKDKYGKHTKWQDWLKDNFHASRQTANVYMQISKGWVPLTEIMKGSEEFRSIQEALQYLREKRKANSDKEDRPKKKSKDKTLSSLRRSLNNILRDEIDKRWTPEEIAYLTTKPELQTGMLREVLEQLHTRIKQSVELQPPAAQPESTETASAKSRQKKKRVESSELDQVCDKLFNPDDAA